MTVPQMQAASSSRLDEEGPPPKVESGKFWIGGAMQEDRYDVLIAGGGPVGLAMALAIGRHLEGARIGLVDRRELAVPQDQRAYAIAAGVRRVFEALDVWGPMAEGATPIHHMRITDSGRNDIARPLYLRFDGDVVPGEPFAHMVANTALTAALLEKVRGQVEPIAPATVTGYEADAAGVRVTLDTGRVLQAPLVIAADGRGSALRGLAGIGTFDADYKQAGIVTTIGHERDHEGTAYEHFRPAGPFASLPLMDADGRGLRSSLVWTESHEAAAQYCAMPLDALGQVIEEVMGASLGAVRVEEAPQSFPLGLRVARRFTGPRLALIGDAAHVVHPVAGQGLNLGLKDVAALAEAVVEAMRLGLDPGSEDVLARYAGWRRLDTGLMVAVTDGMNRLFSNDLAPLRALRDVGLGMVDRVGPLKQAMISHAAGIGRDGPKLLRGIGI